MLLACPVHPPSLSPQPTEPRGLTRTKIQGDLLRCDLCDVQVGLARALAAQRDVLQHAAAAAGVLDGPGTAVCNQVLQEVTPGCDGLGAAEILGGKKGQKESGEEFINPPAGALF